MSDLAQQLQNLKSALQMSGEHNEGTSGSKGDFFGTGDTYESFTWPKEVEIVDDQGEGFIKYPYDAMIRHKHFIAGVETATEDDHHSGTVVAKYQVSRKGKFAIVNIEFQPAQKRSAGNSIVSRLRSLHDTTL